MSLTSPSSPSSEAPKSRTYADVYLERKEEYPRRNKKEHSITNKKDRMDYLIVAYSLMIRKVPDGLQRIMSKGSTDRLTVLKAFEPVGAQLSLWGIIKKVISYDMREDVVVPSVRQVETILLEMQDLFAPVRKVTYVPPVTASPALPSSEPAKKPEILPRSFMGFPVIDPYVLAILDGLQVEEPKVVEQAPVSVPPQPKTQPTPGVSAVSTVVKSKVAPLLPMKASKPPFQQRILPAAPRRGFGKQHWGRTAPFIPYHLRTATALSEGPTEASVSSEPAKPKYAIPQFDDLRGALVHLHGKTDWHDFYRHIEGQLRDDLAVMSYLAQQNGELRAILLNIKAKFGTSMKQIISYLFHPETVPVSQSPAEKPASDSSVAVVEEPEQKTPKPEDPLDIYIRLFDRFKLNDKYMSVVQKICDLHMRGEHEQFLREREKFFQTGKKRKAAHAELFDINAALDEIVLSAQSASEGQTNTDKTKVIFELCEYRPEKGELFVYDAAQEALYAKHTWTTRIAELLVESSQKEVFQKLLSEENESRLVEGLKAITIKIPRHNKHDWTGYEEKEALETRLYFVLEDMVAHQHNGEKNWNKHVTIDELQKLMRKINFSGIE